MSASASDPLALEHDNALYLFDEKYTVIHFLNYGDRPCDFPGRWRTPYNFLKLRVPCNMSIGDLVRRLRLQGHDSTGRQVRAVQEMRKVFKDGHICFEAGMVLDEWGAQSIWTLRAVGWDNARDEANPVSLIIVP